MTEEDLVGLKRKLDNVVLQLTEMIRADIYDNVIVATVRDWFEGNDSVKDLNDKINQNVKDRWPFVEQKVKIRLGEFEDLTKQTLAQAKGMQRTDLDVRAISEGVSHGISLALGAIGSALLGMICGGAGTALIATGPVGWIIGAIIGALGYFLGKTKIEDLISGFIADKKIPALVKKPAHGKVVAQLKLNESRFEQDVFNMLQEQLKPVYEVLKS